jgi:hypothetical protein
MTIARPHDRTDRRLKSDQDHPVIVVSYTTTVDVTLYQGENQTRAVEVQQIDSGLDKWAARYETESAARRGLETAAALDGLTERLSWPHMDWRNRWIPSTRESLAGSGYLR